MMMMVAAPNHHHHRRRRRRHLGFSQINIQTTFCSGRIKSCSVIRNQCRHYHDHDETTASRRRGRNGGITNFKRKNAAVIRRGVRYWTLLQQQRQLQQDGDDYTNNMDTATVTVTPICDYIPTLPTYSISKPSNTISNTTVKSQAALIAGTAIGGGFLALPAATAPCGAGPAALGLCGVWLFLLGGSLSLSNAIFGMKRKRGKGISSQVEKLVWNHEVEVDFDDASHLMSMPTTVHAAANCKLNLVDIDQDEDASHTFTPSSSLSSLIRECYGNIAGLVTGLAFLSLIMLTLIAQLSKIGSLLGNSFPHIDIRFMTTIFTMSMIALCSLCNGRRVERINTVLTGVMLSSFVSLVGLAAVSGRWSVDALKRADYRLLLPTSFLSLLSGSSSSLSSSSLMGSCSPWAIPIFIQLLVYNEVVPLVASRLQDEAKVRRAILLGSSVPLLMCLIWSCVSLGLVPYKPPFLDTAAAATSGSMYSYDPLNKLLRASSMGGSIGKMFSVSVNVLAGSAICTTIIGCILASAQYFEDAMQSTSKILRGSSDGGDSKTPSLVETLYRRIGTKALAIVPSAIIALCGTNRDLYYRAIRLAGAGPVTLLYGLLPPLCNLRLCWTHGLADGKDGTIRSRIHVASQMMLVMISLVILIAGRITS